jgi:hypothetical protein
LNGINTPAVREDGWPIAAPEQVGMDSGILNGIEPRFEK